MAERIAVSYSQWLEYINGAGAKGLKSEAFSSLKGCYPVIGSEAHYGMMQRELAKLETILLKKTVAGFQTAVNRCLEEADPEILEWGIREFKRSVSCCYFFNGIEEYPQTVRKDIGSQMGESLASFVDEYSIFLKKIRENDNSSFIEDFEYICKKAKLKKYIEEFTLYV